MTITRPLTSPSKAQTNAWSFPFGLSTKGDTKKIAGIFLIATPFWGGDKGWKYEGYEALALPEGHANQLPSNAPVFFYHSRDDEIVPFAHLALYAQKFPQATIRELNGGGHQLHNDLSEVVEDIKSLER